MNIFKLCRDVNFYISTVLLLVMLCCFPSAFASQTTPTGDFIDNGDGTVTHKLMGLVWMRCSMGQTWDKTNSTCTGTAATYTLSDAIALKSNFAGHSDWRLPNIGELQTLVEYGNLNPAINTVVFPNTPNDLFWSSSSYFSINPAYWYVDFRYGIVNNRCVGIRCPGSLPVRMVYGGHPLDMGLFTPDKDFSDNGDGTVTHKRTGLMWQRCSMGQIWTGVTCSGTVSGYIYEQAQAQAIKSNFAGHKDWRIPTINELTSIVEYSSALTINTNQFPNQTGWYWTSSHLVGYVESLWTVIFDHGGIIAVSNNVPYPARFVRGWWLSDSLNMMNQSVISVDFTTNYDAKNTKVVELKNTSTNPIEVSNVLMSDAKNYWVNLFMDNKWSCRAKHTGLNNKNFTIPAQSSCLIGVGFSPFDTLTAGQSIAATMTLKTIINGIPTDKLINFSGIGRAQVATIYSGSENSLGGQWGVAQLKGGNPPLKSYGLPKTWFSKVMTSTMQKSTAQLGNVVVLAGNNLYPSGKVGVIIQTNPVMVMLTSTNIKNQNGMTERQWEVKPINWYPIKNSAAITWQPFITGAGTTSNQHYGFIDWASSLY